MCVWGERYFKLFIFLVSSSVDSYTNAVSTIFIQNARSDAEPVHAKVLECTCRSQFGFLQMLVIGTVCVFQCSLSLQSRNAVCFTLVLFHTGPMSLITHQSYAK